MKALTDKVKGRLNQEIARFFAAHHLGTGKPVSYDAFLEDRMLMISAIKAGISYSLFDIIQEFTPFTESEWADFLNISTKSLQRYRTTADYHFKSLHSEKILEMAEVTKVGLDVFGHLGKLKLWMNTPNYALGNLKPLELLRDSYGKEMVIAELTRINHGIFV